MQNIAYMVKYYHISFDELMDLSYSIFLSLMKWARIQQIEQTEEGRDALYKTSIIYQTEPDVGRLRNLTGYKKVEGVD